MKLNTLKANNYSGIKWCGPTALAIITGRTLKYCHNKLAKIDDKTPKQLKGTWNWSMRTALKQMGFSCREITTGKSMTLRQYIEEHQTTEEFRGVMLVQVTRHYVVINRGMVADNHQWDPAPVRGHKMWRKKIKHAWLITRRK